jgi:predicted ATPase
VPIREIHVEGYRSIRDLRLPLRKINILTGPNGSGKSNLYNSVFLLAKAASGGFAHVIAEEGGMPSVLWAGPRRTRSSDSRQRDPVRMTLGVKLETFCYEFICGLSQIRKSAFHLDPEVKEERVWMENGRHRKVTFFERSPNGTWILDKYEQRTNYSGELISTESVLSQLREPHLYPELSELRSEMSRWRFYHHFRTDADSPLRRPQIGVRTPVLSHDGRDLAAALQTIIEIGQIEDLDDAIKQIFPGATLAINSGDGSGSFAVSLHMPGLRRPLSSRELSDGTIRYLCLLAALLSPRPPALLALNEPETSLHPDLLEPLAKQIVNAARNSQLWVVTHSLRLAELVEKYSGESPIRLELDGGETRVSGARIASPD